jgi:hypothetical protein
MRNKTCTSCGSTDYSQALFQCLILVKVHYKYIVNKFACVRSFQPRLLEALIQGGLSLQLCAPLLPQDLPETVGMRLQGAWDFTALASGGGAHPHIRDLVHTLACNSMYTAHTSGVLYMHLQSNESNAHIRDMVHTLACNPAYTAHINGPRSHG